jgi:integrase
VAGVRAVTGPLSPAVTPLRRHAEDYLATRRALGYKLKRHGEAVIGFVRHLDHLGAQRVTTEAALAWATAGRSQAVAAFRLHVAREFSVYLHATDPSCEVVPPGLMTARRERHDPFLFHGGDVLALMGAARRLLPPFRAATYETLIGLLAATGMRVGEAIALDDGDIDWGQGALTVRNTKFGKSRHVPLHPSTVAALRRYRTVRARLCPARRAPSVLVSTVGTRLIYQDVHREWLRLLATTGIGQGAPHRPRPHDLRHRFAVETLTGWYRDGADVAALMPVLSTYMGHVKPSSTFWYLQAAPELLALAAQRLDEHGAARR